MRHNPLRTSIFATKVRCRAAALSSVLALVAGCAPEADSDPAPTISGSQTAEAGKPPIRARHQVDELPFDLVVFETVFWEPRDTASLRRLIHETPLVKDRDVLEIGTGSGLVALCCLHAGAARVVATDVNPAAIANAEYNATMLELDERLEVRSVPLTDRSAFAVVGRDETFDLIISNPPWEDRPARSIDEFALYDEQFLLLDSMLREVPRHLRPGGKLLLAYGNVTAVREVQRLAADYGLQVRVLDKRPLDSLPENFLPGMLLEITTEPPGATDHGKDGGSDEGL